MTGEPQSFGPGFKQPRVPRSERPSFESQLEDLLPSPSPTVSPLSGREGWASELIEFHRAALLGLFQVWLGDRLDPEDLVNDLCVNMLSKSPEPDHPERYLFASARNLAISRSEARYLELSRMHAMPDINALPWAPDDPSVQDELREVFQAALRRIPADLQEDLVSRYFEDLSVKEIAKRQQISLSAAYDRQQRALAAMRRAIRREFP